jgi:hypothetical protein
VSSGVRGCGPYRGAEPNRTTNPKNRTRTEPEPNYELWEHDVNEQVKNRGPRTSLPSLFFSPLRICASFGPETIRSVLIPIAPCGCAPAVQPCCGLVDGDLMPRLPKFSFCCWFASDSCTTDNFTPVVLVLYARLRGANFFRLVQFGYAFNRPQYNMFCSLKSLSYFLSVQQLITEPSKLNR